MWCIISMITTVLDGRDSHNSTKLIELPMANHFPFDELSAHNDISL